MFCSTALLEIQPASNKLLKRTHSWNLLLMSGELVWEEVVETKDEQKWLYILETLTDLVLTKNQKNIPLFLDFTTRIIEIFRFCFCICCAIGNLHVYLFLGELWLISKHQHT